MTALAGSELKATFPTKIKKGKPTMKKTYRSKMTRLTALWTATGAVAALFAAGCASHHTEGEAAHTAAATGHAFSNFREASFSQTSYAPSQI